MPTSVALAWNEATLPSESRSVVPLVRPGDSLFSTMVASEVAVRADQAQRRQVAGFVRVRKKTADALAGAVAGQNIDASFVRARELCEEQEPRAAASGD